MGRVSRSALVAVTATTLVGRDYARLLRPSVLKQLNPPVVRLVNELPRVENVNEALIGGLFARGGLEVLDALVRKWLAHRWSGRDPERRPVGRA